MNNKEIFNIDSEKEFLSITMDTFRYQYAHNTVYRKYCDLLKVDPKKVGSLEDIPFLPIQFFKDHKIVSSTSAAEVTFTSSGTTGSTTSKHFVTDLSLYEESYLKAFTKFYGSPKDYCILALLPSYLERTGSSLIHMVNDLIKRSEHPKSGFFLNDFDKLKDYLTTLNDQNEKTLLIGVSFGLLDFCEQHQLKLNNTIIMETGGMKGRRKELIRKELHEILQQGFGVDCIHSEYGMTELLSQAYSKGNSLFECPPWMRIIIRDTEDPLTLLPNGKVGGINVIDLANKNSCSFIATQDLGKIYDSGKFEILGRYDHSDIRGCNLMAI